MAVLPIIIVALVLFVSAALVVLFGRWVSKSWTVLEDDDSFDGEGDRSLWQRLAGWAGRGPRRLTYRRDERGRFRKHRR